MGVLTFVVTHTVPQEWVYEGSPFTFVTDGVESAVEQAKAVAGDKDVAMGAASIAQQCIRAGLLDEIHVDLAPLLLGGGVRLFEHLGTGPIELERTGVVADAETDLILGMHAVGPHITDLIAEGVFAKLAEGTPEELGIAVHAHPTLSEAFGEAALAVEGRAINF